MKSSDIEYVTKILNTIKPLKYEFEMLKNFKERMLSVAVSCESKSLLFDKDVSQKVLDVVLKEYNIKIEEHIKKLAELGVEYTEEQKG